MTMDLNTADAARVHYVDPRVRQLAEEDHDLDRGEPDGLRWWRDAPSA